MVIQMIKNLPTMWETQVQSLCQEDHLDRGMATHSNILGYRTLWTEVPGRLQSKGLQTDTIEKLTYTHKSGRRPVLSLY